MLGTMSYLAFVAAVGRYLAGAVENRLQEAVTLDADLQIAGVEESREVHHLDRLVGTSDHRTCVLLMRRTTGGAESTFAAFTVLDSCALLATDGTGRICPLHLEGEIESAKREPDGILVLLVQLLGEDHCSMGVDQLRGSDEDVHLFALLFRQAEHVDHVSRNVHDQSHAEIDSSDELGLVLTAEEEAPRNSFGVFENFRDGPVLEALFHFLLDLLERRLVVGQKVTKPGQVSTAKQNWLILGLNERNMHTSMHYIVCTYSFCHFGEMIMTRIGVSVFVFTKDNTTFDHSSSPAVSSLVLAFFFGGSVASFSSSFAFSFFFFSLAICLS